MNRAEPQFNLKILSSRLKKGKDSAAGGDQKGTLVLLPGFMCDETVWQAQADVLSDLVTCMIADWGDLDSFTEMAEAVLRAAPERFSLAGHSMGGRVAFQLYRLAPERVMRLALFNTGSEALPAGQSGEEEARKRHELLDLARSAGMRAMAMKWLGPMIAPRRIDDGELVEAIVRMIERKTPDIFEAQMKALLARPNATPLLKLIHCPTLLLSGREDGWSPPFRHEQMAGMIPGSKLVVIPDCGHMSTMEQPGAVAQVMRSWLEET